MTLYTPFNRLIMHHTGGSLKANAVDREAYHTITNGDGEIVPGMHPIEANAAGKKLSKGRYAAHTKNLNSGSIGKAIAAMGKGEWSDPYSCKNFPTPTQLDRFFFDVAETALAHLIPVTREHLLSHAEVQRTLGVKQNNKWDFDYSLRGNRAAARDPVGLGDEYRQEIARIMDGIRKQGRFDTLSHDTTAVAGVVAEITLRRGDTGDLVRDLQKFLGIRVDGAYGPVTEAAVAKFQKKVQLLPDGVAGPMTLAWVRKAKERAL